MEIFVCVLKVPILINTNVTFVNNIFWRHEIREIDMLKFPVKISILIRKNFKIVCVDAAIIGMGNIYFVPLHEHIRN